MFGATRRVSRFASGSSWGNTHSQQKFTGLLIAAGATTATAAGIATVPEREDSRNSIRTITRRHPSIIQLQSLVIPFSINRAICEAAVLDDNQLEEEPVNEEEERFLDTLALYRRWFDDIKKQWEISKPASTQWPTNIPQERDIKALEIDLQLYLNGDQANTRRRQDLQFRIASYYLFREKSVAEQKKGFKMIQELAVDGHADGLCLYAMIWNHGNVAGIEAKPHLAVKFWRQAADMGHMPSQYELGVALYMGDGAVEDPAQAVSYFRKAADLGHSGAAYLLADCYLDGVGVRRDRSKAFEWLMTAAEMGHRQAQRRGEALLLGIASEPNSSSSSKLEQEESMRWECSPPSDWYRKVSLERRFSIGGGSRNPTILFRRKTKVAESRRSAD